MVEKVLVAKSPFILTDAEIEIRLGETLEGLTVLKNEYDKLKVSGVDDENGYKIVHTAKMEMVHKRNDIKKNGLSERKDANDFCASVLRIEKRLYAAISPIEDHLISQEKIVDDEKARIKEEAAAVEAARVQARIDRLFALGCSFNGMNYVLPFIPCSAGYSVPGAIAKTCSDEQFETIYAEFQRLINIENARLEKEKADRLAEEERLTKVRAEQEAEAERLNVIAKQQKAAQDKIDKENERIAAVIRNQERCEELEIAKKEAAEKAVKEAEEKRVKEEKETTRKIEQERIAAEKKAAKAPDKRKIQILADLLDDIKTPDVKTEDGKAVVLWAMMAITELVKRIRDKVEAL